MSVGTVATVAALLFVGLAAFQVAVALGAPFGHIVYGGRFADPGQPLPPRWRAASAVAALVLLGFAWVMLARGGVIDTSLSETLLTVLAWMVVAYMALNTAANLAARSPIERYVFGGITGVIVVLGSIVAAAGPT
jgi:hypothetical protein